MEKELWLSRDKGSGDRSLYNIHETEPHIRRGGIFNDWISTFCPVLFHSLVQGARLRKGRKRKIKRILIELED